MGAKAVRFSKDEEKLIDEFLERNPFFDFSTLARVAILSFIKKPEMPLCGVSQPTRPLHSQRQSREI